jgi:hypothetical protein
MLPNEIHYCSIRGNIEFCISKIIIYRSITANGTNHNTQVCGRIFPQVAVGVVVFYA